MHSEKPRKKKIHKHENTYTGDILKRQEAIIMMTEDRYTAILDALKERKSMTVAEFTEITGASESTIRRDLIALDDMGKIKRSMVVPRRLSMNISPMRHRFQPRHSSTSKRKVPLQNTRQL